MSSNRLIDQNESLRTGDSVERRIPGAQMQRAQTLQTGVEYLLQLRPFDVARDGGLTYQPDAVPRSQADGLQHVQNPQEVAKQTAYRLADTQQTQVDAGRAAARLAAPTPPPQFNIRGGLN